jgi:hypothetical protein
MVVLRADPWNPEYGMGFEAQSEETPLPQADPFVETTDWSTPRSPAAEAPPEVWFVDGVRRVELRLLAEDDGRTVPGLFGSFAVGAVHCDDNAAFGEHRVGRALVLGGGVRPAEADVRCGAGSLTFAPVTESGTDPNRPLLRLQELMRAAENDLAAWLVGGGARLVLADGPLRLGEEGDSPVVGVVKRFVRRYLEPEQESLLGRLGRGERTPVFALHDREGAVRGYSWYARLTDLVAPWHDRAGIVRCEVRAGVGLPRAVDLADLVTVLLPAFAGRASDPRTPQNLAPVAGLEVWLRHRMGDHGMVRRSLVAWLMAKEA